MFKSDRASGRTHIDLKVFGRGVDAAVGRVVAWEVVQRHMGYLCMVRESDGQSSLGPGQRPTFPCVQL